MILCRSDHCRCCSLWCNNGNQHQRERRKRRPQKTTTPTATTTGSRKMLAVAASMIFIMIACGSTASTTSSSNTGALASATSSSSSPSWSRSTAKRRIPFLFGRASTTSSSSSLSPPFLSVAQLPRGGGGGGGDATAGAGADAEAETSVSEGQVEATAASSTETAIGTTPSSPPSSSSTTTSIPSTTTTKEGKHQHQQQHQHIVGGSSGTEDRVTDNSNATSSSSNSTLQQLIPAWKLKLPQILRDKKSSFQKLKIGTVDVYVLGTAHVSNDSSRDVRVLLDCVHPQAILVELCEARIPMLTQEEEEVPVIPPTTVNGTTTNVAGAENNNNTTRNGSGDETFWERVTNIQQSQGGSRFQALSTHLLTSVQEDYAKDLGVELGGEFQCAHGYWKEQRRMQAAKRGGGGPHLILGDRPLQLTLVRAWESLWWWPKMKVMAGLLWSCWRKPSPKELREWLESILREESDLLTKSFEELKRHFPTLYRTIVAERDAWLAAKLVQTCNGLSRSNQPCTLVAIVGAGHVPGICQWLTNSTIAGNFSTPEQVLNGLAQTKRWANDEAMQKEAIPMWVNEVQELEDVPAESDQSFAWAQPSPAI